MEEADTPEENKIQSEKNLKRTTEVTSIFLCSI